MFQAWEMEKGDKDGKVLLSLLLFAFLVRLILLFYPEVIHNDGIEYIRHAKSILRGDWSEGKSAPLYPALIALFQLIVPNAETAGIMISVIFGAGLVLPVFYLGKGLFHRQVGILGALFAAVHPVLTAYSGSVLTESTYFFFFSLSLLFSWNAFKTGKGFDVGLCGFFTALTYLVRPEALGLLVVFLAWLLFINPPGGERRFAKKVAILTTVVATVFVFSFPYLLAIQKDTGRWQISKKAVLSIGSLTEEEEAPSFGKPRGEKGLTLSSVIKHPLPVLGRLGAGFLGVFYKFIIGLTPPLFLFAAAGWAFMLGKKGFPSLKGNSFLLSHVLFYFGLVFPFFFVSKRYAAQMIGITLPWAAFGFLKLAEWIHGRWREKIPFKQFTVWILIFLLAGLFVQGRFFHTREHRVIRRELGFWMKDHLPKEAVVMSRLPQEAFYSGMTWVQMSGGSYEEILEKARSKQVHYLITDDKVISYSPDFLEKAKRKGDLKRIHEFKREGQCLIIWELLGSPEEG